MTIENGYVQFKRLIEQKNKNGTSSWVQTHTLQPCSLLDITITTLSDYEKVEKSCEPFIVPMGLKSCICKIIGKFQSHMIIDCVNGTKIGSEVSDENILNTTNTDTENTVRIALQVNDGLSDFPELAGIWTIKSFMWDRNAKELGSYQFTIELSYVFTKPYETQIYKEDTAFTIRDNVSFICLINNISYPIFNTMVHETSNDINSAKFSTVKYEFHKDDQVKICLAGDSSYDYFFNGYIKNVINNQNGTYTYECKEIGYCMYEMPIVKTTGGIFKSRMVIHNPLDGHGQLKVKDFVKAILSFYKSHPRLTYSPGNGTCRAGDLDTKETIPGREEKLPAMVISGMVIGKALDTFLENTCGFSTWYHRKTGALEYGFIRDPITVNPLTEFILSTEKLSDDGALSYAPDIVCVWNSDGSDRAFYPFNASFDPGEVTIMNFRLSSNNYNGTLEAMAERIYSDAHVTTDIFKVKFPPGTTRFKECDYFSGLGDQTVEYKMTYLEGTDADPLTDPKDTVWKITDVVISESGTTIVVGPSYYSIFDIYRTSLSPAMDGVPFTTETITEKTGTYVAGNTKTTEGTI